MKPKTRKPKVKKAVKKVVVSGPRGSVEVPMFDSVEEAFEALAKVALGIDPAQDADPELVDAAKHVGIDAIVNPLKLH